MAKLLTVSGIIMLFYGICLAVFSNINLGTVLVLLLGVFLFAYGIFYKKINSFTQKGVLKYARIFILIALVLEFVFVGFLGVYGQRDNVTYNEDAIVVLGAGIRGDKVTLPLKYRLDKAIEYSRTNPDALIVVTGGQGFQETVTEAYAMEKYLVENGVSKEKIIKEEKATSTNENMRFSKKILDKEFNFPYKIAVITNGFHIYRGVSIARIEGFGNVTHLHAGLQWYNILPCFLRETLAVLKMWVMG